jgi:hypothetical protein
VNFARLPLLPVRPLAPLRRSFYVAESLPGSDSLTARIYVSHGLPVARLLAAMARIKNGIPGTHPLLGDEMRAGGRRQCLVRF